MNEFDLMDGDAQYGYAYAVASGAVTGPVDYEAALRKIGDDRDLVLMARLDEDSPWRETADPPAAYVWMPVSRDLWEDEPEAREYLRGQMRETLAEKVRTFGFVPDGDEQELAAPLGEPLGETGWTPQVLVKLSVPVRRP